MRSSGIEVVDRSAAATELQRGQHDDVRVAGRRHDAAPAGVAARRADAIGAVDARGVDVDVQNAASVHVGGADGGRARRVPWAEDAAVLGQDAAERTGPFRTAAEIDDEVPVAHRRCCGACRPAPAGSDRRG